jgi:hypothetical protein
MRYENLTRLLSEVVTDSGKIDYLRLLERRDTFQRVIAEFGECGPDNNAGAFPTEDDELAYWLNAYNAFTLHAIMDEYPITSVWKTRDGQFFQRPAAYRRRASGEP